MANADEHKTYTAEQIHKMCVEILPPVDDLLQMCPPDALAVVQPNSDTPMGVIKRESIVIRAFMERVYPDDDQPASYKWQTAAAIAAGLPRYPWWIQDIWDECERKTRGRFRALLYGVGYGWPGMVEEQETPKANADDK